MDGSGLVIPLILVVAVVLVVAFSVRAAKQRREYDAADGVVASLATPQGRLRLSSTTFYDGQSGRPLAGVHASVEDSGTVHRRFSLTRLALLGPAAVAFPKKLDDRELYLTIEGPEWVVVRAIALKTNPSAAVAAREFVAKVNHAASRLTDPV